MPKRGTTLSMKLLLVALKNKNIQNGKQMKTINWRKGKIKVKNTRMKRWRRLKDGRKWKRKTKETRTLKKKV